MTMLGAFTFMGASGTVYLFDLFAWGSYIGPAGAVYLITARRRKKDGGHAHKLILVGQARALSRGLKRHRKGVCVRDYSANCIGVLRENNTDRRAAIEQDLIRNYHPPSNESSAMSKCTRATVTGVDAPADPG